MVRVPKNPRNENPRKLKEKSRLKASVGYLIQSGYMESCLAAQKRFLLIKGPGSLKIFLKIGGNVAFSKVYRLIPLTPSVPGHLTIPLNAFPNFFSISERSLLSLKFLDKGPYKAVCYITTGDVKEMRNICGIGGVMKKSQNEMA
jgi:hypothetical protein